MCANWLTNDGHLVEAAVVSMGLVACYMRQQPSVFHEVALSLLTRLPYARLRSLMEEAEQRLALTRQKVEDLPGQFPERYDRLKAMVADQLYLRHPVLDRQLPLSELLLCYGSMEHEDFPRRGYAYHLAQPVTSRLRVSKDKWEEYIAELKQMGVPLDDPAFFRRCVEADPLRYQDIYNDLRTNMYISPLRQKSCFEDTQVLFLQHIVESDYIVPDDKSYILQSANVRDKVMLQELVRQAEQRPLLRGLSRVEQQRLVSVQLDKLTAFINSVSRFAHHAVFALKGAFQAHDPVEMIVSPYLAIQTELLGANRIWQTSWDCIAGQQELALPRDVAEAVGQLVGYFGTDRVDVRDLKGKTVGEAQYDYLARLMANRGLMAVAERDRMGFMAFFYWGSGPELRQWVEEAVSHDKGLNRMTATERYLQELPGTPERLKERLNRLFVRYMRNCGVVLDLTIEQVAALLRPRTSERRLPSRWGVHR